MLHRIDTKQNTEQTRNFCDSAWHETVWFRIGLVFIGFCVSFVLLPRVVEAGEATLKIDPPQGTFYVGSSFDASIILDTGGETINAVETELRFPQNTLQVTSPSATRSFVAIWTSPPSYSNQDGFVRFQGGIPSPGLKTSQGVLSTISFRAAQPGTVVLELRDSRVLLADGSGTNIFSRAFGARYTIAIPPPQGPAVSSITHPEFTKWYRDKFVAFSWNKDERVTDFSWSLDQNPNGIPDVESEGGGTSVSYKDLEDGIWYFHIRAKEGEVWGGVTTFSVKIDTEPPAQFLTELEPKESVTVKTRTSATFRTTDTLSGVGRYEIGIVNVSGGGETRGSTFFVEGVSPYVLPELPVGIYNVVVRAYDIAGNVQESSATLEVREPFLGPFLTQGLDLGFKVVRWSLVLVPLLGVTLLLVLLALRLWRRYGSLPREARLRAPWTRRLKLPHKARPPETKTVSPEPEPVPPPQEIKMPSAGLQELKEVVEKEREARERRDAEKTGKLREQFEREMKELKRKVEDDSHLRGRLGEQLKKFYQISEASARLKEEGSKKGIFGGGLKNVIVFFAISSAVFFAFTGGARAEEFTSDTLPVPKILTHQLEIASNQLLYLRGIAPLKSLVTIYIAGENQETIQTKTSADENGEWEHLHDLYLQPGFFRIWAEAEDPMGRKSKPSEPVTFRVTSRVVGERGSFGTEAVFGIAAVLFTLLNMSLVGFILYSRYRFDAARKRVYKETREVHGALKIGFALIKRELEEDLELLEKNIVGEKNKAVLAKEKKIRKTLLEDLKKVENSIQKEVSDIYNSF